MNKNFFKEFSDFTNKLFSNNDFFSKFGNVEDLFTNEEKGTEDNNLSYKKTCYEKYENGNLVKKKEVVYENGEMVKNETYETPITTLEDTKEKHKICKCNKKDNNNGGVCKCGNKNGRCGQEDDNNTQGQMGVNTVVNENEIQGYEEIIRRGLQQIYDENTSLKEQNSKLQEENNNFKSEIVKYQTELENINGFIKIYQETLREQNDKIQELVDKLTQYKEIEKLFNQIRK